MTDQIDMIYLKIFLYFDLYQNYPWRIKLISLSVDGFDINRNLRNFLNKSCHFDPSF